MYCVVFLPFHLAVQNSKIHIPVKNSTDRKVQPNTSVIKQNKNFLVGHLCSHNTANSQKLVNCLRLIWQRSYIVSLRKHELPVDVDLVAVGTSAIVTVVVYGLLSWLQWNVWSTSFLFNSFYSIKDYLPSIEQA